MTLETFLELITPELRQQLLANGETSRANPHFDPHPVVKWFSPCGAATWFITELDPNDDDTAYGLGDLGMGNPELGPRVGARTDVHPADARHPGHRA